MKIPLDLKLDAYLKANKTEARLSYEYANLEGTTIFLTSGISAISVPIERDEEDKDGLVHYEPLEIGRRDLKKDDVFYRVLAHEDIIELPEKGITCKRDNNNGQLNFPGVSKFTDIKLKGKTARVGFNVNELALICKALGGNGVVELHFEIQEDGEANKQPIVIKLTGRAPEGTRAVIMPVRL